MRVARSGDGSEAGFVVVELVAGIAVLVLPVALLVLSLPMWAARQDAARVIAREIGRTVARQGVCDIGLARTTASVMAANLGLEPGEVAIELDCTASAVLAAGSNVSTTVTVTMPAVEIPALGGVGGWQWSARHREPVDVYVSEP